MMKRTPWFSVLLKYICTYVVIAILVISVLMPMYWTVLKNERENKINETYRHLKNAAYKFQHEIRKLNSFLYNLRINRDLVKLSLVGDNERLKDIYMLNVYYYIKDILFDNQLNSEIILQFVNNNVLLTSNRIFDNKMIFYDWFFQYEDMDYQEWQEQLYSVKRPIWESKNVITLNNKYKAFTVNFYYPSSLFVNVIASIIIPESTLWGLVMTDEIRQHGFVYLLDQNSNIIASYNYEYEPLSSTNDVNYRDEGAVYTVYLKNEKYTVFEIPDFGYDLKLVLGMPYTVYERAVYPVKKLILLYTTIALLIATVLSMLFAYYNYTPFKALVSFINNIRQKEVQTSMVDNSLSSNYNVSLNRPMDVYTYIRTVVEEIVSSKESLKQAFFNTRYAYRLKLLKEVIYGNIVSENEKATLLDEFSCLVGNYIMCLIEFQGLLDMQSCCELNRYEAILEEIIRGNFKEAFVCKINNSICAVIGLTITKDGYGNVKDRLMSVIENEIFDGFDNLNVFLGISNIHSGIEQLSSAYVEALLCVRLAKSMRGTRIMFYDEVPGVSKHDSIGLSDYYLLFSHLMAGNRTEVIRFFEDLSNKAFNYIVSPNYFKMTYYVISFVLSSVQEKLCMKDVNVEGLDMRSSVEIDKNLDQLFKIAMRICDEVEKQKDNKKNRLKEEILTFLKSNFNQPDLCLAVIAEKFNISERYASQFIKETTGYNYTQLIEELRMHEAQKLLKETDIPVAEIARLVGYYNNNTFYKSFKRIFNMSPKEYRESFKKPLQN